MAVTIQTRRDDSLDWSTANPVLALGEIGIETDTDKAKYGDGFTAWNDLPYWIDEGAQIPDGTVQGQTLRYNLTDDGWEATSALIVADAGNVGIGTAAPGLPLTVAGTVQNLAGLTTTGTRARMSFDSAGSTAFGNTIGGEGNNLVFQTGGGAERMRIASDGRVGIAIAPVTSGAKLQVLTAGGISEPDNSVTASFCHAGMTTVNGAGGVEIHGSAFGAGYANKLATLDTGEFVIGQRRNSTTFVERLRVDGSGNLLVGSTTAGAFGKFQVYNATDASAVMVRKGTSTDSASQIFVTFAVNDTGVGAGQIVGAGAGACAFGAFSDVALKENISPLGSQLAKVMALNPVTFDYKAGGSNVGFIAQEVEKQYPEHVSGEEGEKLLAGFDRTTAVLVKAIQEQQAQIDELRALIDG